MFGLSRRHLKCVGAEAPIVGSNDPTGIGAAVKRFALRLGSEKGLRRLSVEVVEA